mgnify:FL=1
MKYDGIIFDFDGVLVESEAAGNEHLARLLTDLGHPTTREEALTRYTGLSGRDFIDAIEARIGGPLPTDFYARRAEEDARALAQGVGEVAGAVAFVRSLPADWPKAIASSSSTRWIEAHLRHLDLLSRFAGRIFSGKEHVKRGKPAPDIYLHAAAALGIGIDRTVILEDSEVGVRGAVASGAIVIGVAAGTHCLPGHADRLRALGANAVAESFDEVAAMVF